MVSLVPSIHQGLGDLGVVRTFSEGRRRKGSSGEKEREVTEKRQRERKRGRESRERKRVYECVWSYNTTQHKTTRKVTN
ncbi:hypothetical protein D8674_038727 [Pyrus ussuriensis x Pyrus communis]|uniref:Uncharacterized protein n=1 Tax=Pyrus ussuriensis x Pyrus communis TaxID=2448454 RepID=A0A5N5HY96_9ROSA|nr:hypothetical protein D8674_038727 [Pyrus ussuriensis x Pyrus communis]